MENENASERVRAAFNLELKALFGLIDQATIMTPDSASRDILYGKEPDEVSEFVVREREFGVELYNANPRTDRKIAVVAQHGYGGVARDYSKLAAILNERGITVFSLDMHKQGKNDFERMSMNIDEWADVAIQTPCISQVSKLSIERFIFIGQSSGGSSGAEIAMRGRDEHKYNGALLIGPTLVTGNPEFVRSMDAIFKKYASGYGDIMVDWQWLAPLFPQMKNPALNRAYQAHFTTTPGFPYRSAREAMVIPREELINRLSNVDIPLFMVKGDEDRVDEVSLPTASTELQEHLNPLVELLPNIYGAGHQAHIERPEEIVALVEQLIQKIA